MEQIIVAQNKNLGILGYITKENDLYNWKIITKEKEN
jgi:hypothetical protein